MASVAASTASETGLEGYQRMRRAVIAALLVLLATLLLFIKSSQPELVHEEIELWGMMLMLVGIGGRLWSTLYIGGRKSSVVVDIGPYSVTRNPLYFFSAIAAAGVGMQVGSWVLGIVFAVLCWAAFLVVIRKEESFLRRELGQPYLDYFARVPRFFPNLLLYKDRQEVTFRPKLLLQTLVDGLAFFLAVPIFELIEKGQASGIIPVMLSLP